MMFKYSKILIDKYTRKTKHIFLMDSYLSGIRYIRNFNLKMRDATVLDLYREYNSISLNSVAIFNENKEKVGYLPKDQSEVIARLIDAGKKIIAIPIPFDEEVALKVYMIDQIYYKVNVSFCKGVIGGYIKRTFFKIKKKNVNQI